MTNTTEDSGSPLLKSDALGRVLRMTLTAKLRWPP